MRRISTWTRKVRRKHGANIYRLMGEVADRFNEVWPILQKIDDAPAKKHARKLAVKKHTEYLKGNRDIFGRVPTTKDIEREYMSGLNMLWAMAIVQIIDDIKENEERDYMNLRFKKVRGRVHVKNIGWDWMERSKLFKVRDCKYRSKRQIPMCILMEATCPFHGNTGSDICRQFVEKQEEE